MEDQDGRFLAQIDAVLEAGGLMEQLQALAVRLAERWEQITNMIKVLHELMEEAQFKLDRLVGRTA